MPLALHKRNNVACTCDRGDIGAEADSTAMRMSIDMNTDETSTTANFRSSSPIVLCVYE